MPQTMCTTGFLTPMTMSALPLRPWWDREPLERFLRDIVSAELARLRPGWAPTGNDTGWGKDFGKRGLDLDSLERLRLAETVAEALDLSATGDSDHLQQVGNLEQLGEEVSRLLPSASQTIGFLTSGSTGRPKRVQHRLADLDQETAVLAGLVGPVRRIVSMIPASPIYGFLFTILLPHRLGVPVLDLRGQTAGSLAARLAPGDLVVGTPPTWAALAGRGGWSEGLTGVSSGAPCPAQVAARLREAGLRLLEIYGSTETGGIGWRTDERDPYQLLPMWVRDGDERIASATGGVGRSLDLPDHVTWDGPDRLRPTSRRDHAVQVAGVNVWPERVRSVLLAHPAVAEARVRLMRPDEGDTLKAFVVPRGLADASDLRRHLDGWCRARLSPPELPRVITLGDALPVTRSGKPGDWLLDED